MELFFNHVRLKGYKCLFWYKSLLNWTWCTTYIPFQLYPLVILEAHTSINEHYLDYEESHVAEVNADKTDKDKTDPLGCWDWQTCKIGSCIIIILLVAVGAFIAYLIYQRYCCWFWNIKVTKTSKFKMSKYSSFLTLITYF